MLGRAASAALGAVILFLAAPRLIGAVVALPGNPVATMLENGEKISAKAADTLARARERSLAWDDTAQARTELALAFLRHPDHPDPTLGAAQLREALARAPVDPYDWTRLAWLDFSAGAPGRQVADEIAMALETGPAERPLVMARLELCLAAWSYLAPATQEAALAQVRLGWKIFPQPLAELLRRRDRLDLARAALSPEEFEALEQRAARLPPP